MCRVTLRVLAGELLVTTRVVMTAARFHVEARWLSLKQVAVEQGALVREKVVEQGFSTCQGILKDLLVRNLVLDLGRREAG